jgi:hypothetical protein
LEFGLQFVGETIDVLRVGLVVALEAIGEAGRDQAERVDSGSARNIRRIMLPPAASAPSVCRDSPAAGR